MEQEKTPKLRFKGYNDPWEQRKLGDVGTTYTGLSGKTKEDFGHGNGQFVTYMNVFSNPVGLPDMTEPVEIDDSQNKVLFGDVLFTTSSETPEEVGMSSVWIENTENTYLNSFCFGYRPTVEFDPYYLAYMLRSFSMRKKITFLAQGISRYNISKNKMMDIEIPVPTMSEQQQIGAYFRNLDNLITLHQRKLEQIKQVKRSMLEKMFPRDGEDVPEIRFAGFTDPWEQRKVSDILSDVERPIAMQDDETYQLVTVKRRNEGIVSRGFFKGKDILVKNYYRIHEGDFLISKRQVIHGANGYVPKSLDNAVVSNEYMVAESNEDISSAFWALISQRKDMYQMYLFSSYGVDVEKMVFNVDDWKKRSIIIPNLEEQTVIVSLFSQLDHLITLHQRKLEMLKNMKKSMLEKMFPQEN